MQIIYYLPPISRLSFHPLSYMVLIFLYFQFVTCPLLAAILGKQSYRSPQLGLSAAVIVTSTTKGSMLAKTIGGGRGNDLGFRGLSCQEGCRAEQKDEPGPVVSGRADQIQGSAFPGRA